MIIDVRNTDVVYITTSTGKTIYLDDSTNELIVDAWDMEGQPIEPMIMFTPDFEIKPPTQTTLTLVKGEDDDEKNIK